MSPCSEAGSWSGAPGSVWDRSNPDKHKASSSSGKQPGRIRVEKMEIWESSVVSASPKESAGGAPPWCSRSSSSLQCEKSSLYRRISTSWSTATLRKMLTEHFLGGFMWKPKKTWRFFLMTVICYHFFNTRLVRVSALMQRCLQMNETTLMFCSC